MTTAKTVNGRLKPYLDKQSTNVLNLTVLQRSDPFIQEILITISHVTLYEFNIELNQWSRKDVEGSLFVVRRNTQPQFQFIVMNRLNAENFVEHLVQDFEYEVQIPYLLYRNAAQKINGIWFYVTYDCEEVANLFSRLLGAQSKVYPNSQVTSRDSEIRELEAVPTSAVIEGPLEPEVTAACSRDRPVDSSLADFQRTAMRTGGYSTQDDIYSRQLFDKKACSNSLSRVHDETHSRVSNISSPPVTSRPTPTMNLSDRFEPFSNSQPANLVKPSCFDGAGATPPMIGTPHASLISSPSSVDYACHPLMIPQHQQLGTQMLQPFPPPTPSPTLPQHFNANLTTTPNYGQLNRERVHNALQTLVQDNQFIDMVYQALMKAHQS